MNLEPLCSISFIECLLCIGSVLAPNMVKSKVDKVLTLMQERLSFLIPKFLGVTTHTLTNWCAIGISDLD